MIVKNIEWKYSKGKVHEAMLSEIERYFNVSFPDFYKEIVREYNGARPRPNTLHTMEGKEIKIRSFLPIGKDYPDNLIETNKRLNDKLPQKIIAFANDDFGNYFCFDFTKTNKGEVVFWDHENFKFHKMKNDNLQSVFGSNI
jgi:hypothetical protein